jgi:membrane protein YdbS with pleckstrin-like domain
MQFSLRPVFVGWIAVVVQLPFQLFFTIWAGGFFGGMSATLLHVEPPPFVIFGAAAFVLVPLVSVLGKKLNYERTEYRFYDDRLEFDEGYFNVNRKVVRYEDVLEITLRKGFLQRFCGLGTIYLATEATGSTSANNPFFALGFGNISGSGVGIRDLTDPDGNYERLKGLVYRHNRGPEAPAVAA